MSWLFSRALVEAYSPVTFSDGRPSAPSRTTGSPPPFFSHGKMTARFPRILSGMTCAPLTEEHGEAVLTSYLAAFPAKIYPAQEPEPESLDPGLDSGKKCPESWERYDLDLSSLKTRRVSKSSGLKSSCEILPPSGMMWSGACWERPMLAPPTSAKGSGSSRIPTPTAGDAKASGSRNAGSKANPGISLTDWVRGDGGTGRLPTPTSSENNYRLQGDSQQSKCLNAMAGGKLNPTWVEWLMNWPLGWTNCYQDIRESQRTWLQRTLAAPDSAPLEMAKCPSPPQLHSESWPEEEDGYE